MTVFNEQHEMFRAAVRSFVDKEVAPHVEEWETAGRMPGSLWRRMGELGFFGGPKISIISPLGSRRRPALTSHGGDVAGPRLSRGFLRRLASGPF